MKVADKTAELIVEDLRVLGYNAVPNSQGCKIKLPLWSSVTIMFQQDSIRFLPKVGRTSLTVSTWGSLLLLVVTFSLFSSNFEAASPNNIFWVSMFFFSIVDLVWSGYSYILTESATSTVRNLLVSKYIK
jgi:hypothetical protein